MSGLKLLATGATGYMGGSFLAQLLASSEPEIRKLSFSAVVRKQEQADVLANHGVNAILVQDLDDTAALKRVASEHDIVIHSANGFHPASAQALIEGLAERKRITGREVYYIQTSGTSNLASQPVTNPDLPPAPPDNNNIFSDTASNIHAYLLAREALEPYAQRTTDLTVVRTGKATGVKTVIVMSPTVYGVGMGLFNKRSIQRPLLIRAALAKGRAVYVGDDDGGAGEWDHVHVQDLAELYELLVKKLLVVHGGEEEEELYFGEQGIYFASSGRPHSWKALAEAVGKAGFELGALKTAEPMGVSLGEFAREWLGGNEQLAELGFTSRAVTDAQRSRSLGWQPRKTDEDWWASFKEEFAAIWAQTKA